MSKYIDAFRLMSYQCGSCKHIESIWNSRDGVVPFMTQCPNCNLPSFVHVNWADDLIEPNFHPRDGQLIWDGLPNKPQLKRWKDKR